MKNLFRSITLASTLAASFAFASADGDFAILQKPATPIEFILMQSEGDAPSFYAVSYEIETDLKSALKIAMNENPVLDLHEIAATPRAFAMWMNSMGDRISARIQGRDAAKLKRAFERNLAKIVASGESLLSRSRDYTLLEGRAQDAHSKKPYPILTLVHKREKKGLVFEVILP